MPERATRRKPHWEIAVVPGSSGEILEGRAGTARAPSGHPATSFPATSTVILGYPTQTPKAGLSSTHAAWKLSLARQARTRFHHGYLFVSCLRRFGGLHSRKFDARVEVLLNASPIDGFGLRVKPPGHADFFHEVNAASPPPRTPIGRCETVYSWSLVAEQLADAPEQVVEVRLDPAARWDIDYVALAIQLDSQRHDVFLSHSWQDKRLARRVAKDLETLGVRVWVDEAEMRLGDSLIAKIAAAIDSVSFVVAMLSRAAVESPWVQKELEIAMTQEIEGRRVKVIPCIVENCPIPVFLRDKLRGDLRGPTYAKTIQGLLNLVTAR